MFIDFNKMPLDSRIWVFHSNKSFSENQIVKMNKLIHSFCNEWTSHQNNVLSSFLLVENLFLVISANQSATSVSGCSIDKLFHFISMLENKYECELTKRTLLTFYIDDKRCCCEKNEIKKLYKQKIIKNESKVVNTMVQTVEEFNKRWHISFKESWAYKLV